MSKYVAYEVRHDFFSNLNEESAWVAGLLASDGHVAKSGHRVGISQSGEHGREIIKWVADLLEFQGNIGSYFPRRGAEVHSINFTSAQIVTDLARLGIVNNKTLTYSYPALPDHLNNDFLRGYIDGDGSVGVYDNSKNCRHLVISLVGTREFVQGVKAVVPIAPVEHRITRCENLWDIRWNGKKAVEAGRWLYDGSRVDTKKTLIWKNYLCELDVAPPKWYLDAQRKGRVLELLDLGHSVKEVAKMLDESYKIVHKWAKGMRE